MSDRRQFLRLLVAVGAAAMIPWRLASSSLIDPREYGAVDDDTPPKLWGDGWHDDTAAVQWYVDHAIPVPHGHAYMVTDTIVVRPGGSLHAANIFARRGVDPIIRVLPPSREAALVVSNVRYLP